jgi:spore germination protein GerM
MTQQIRLTLLQFSTIKDVVISVEGKTEGILEP